MHRKYSKKQRGEKHGIKRHTMGNRCRQDMTQNGVSENVNPKKLDTNMFHLVWCLLPRRRATGNMLVAHLHEKFEEQKKNGRKVGWSGKVSANMGWCKVECGRMNEDVKTCKLWGNNAGCDAR